MSDAKTQESIDWLNRAHQRTVSDAITDGVMVQLFYAAQGDITQFRIKGRKIIETASAHIPLEFPEDVAPEMITPEMEFIYTVWRQFKQDACVPGDDRVSESFITAARVLMGAQAERITELETMLSGERSLKEIWKERASVWCLAADARAVHGSDLLEVLKELVKQHDEGFWSTWQTTAHFDAPLTAARAAIAKADGAKP